MKRKLLFLIIIFPLFGLIGLSLYPKKAVLQINADQLSTNKKVIVSGSWGTLPGQFGKILDSELLGPMSFFVNKERVFLLDQVNKRVQEFSLQGRLLGIIPIDRSTYEDIVVKDDNLYLLDSLVKKSVSIFDLNGSFLKSVALTKDSLPATQLLQKNEFIYVEKEHQYLYEIADNSGFKSQSEQIRSRQAGQPTNEGNLTASLNGNFVELNIDKESLVKAWISSGYTAQIISLNSDADGNIYLGVNLIKEGKNFKPLEDVIKIVKLAPNSSPLAQFSVPNQYIAAHFKKIFVDEEGRVFQLVTTQTGVQVVQWKVPE